MNPRVYVETTVISYLTARPARDVVVAGHQQSTRDWWTTAADRYELVVSELVREEAGLGDPDAVRARLTVLTLLATLDATAEAEPFAEVLVRTAALPEAATRDAAHIDIAAPSGVEYLVTWNFRHIPNAATSRSLSLPVAKLVLTLRQMCTLEELMENIDNDE